jgi:hypothetical protein
MAAVRKGEALAVTQLDRLARPLPDARDIADELTGARLGRRAKRRAHLMQVGGEQTPGDTGTVHKKFHGSSLSDG